MNCALCHDVLRFMMNPSGEVGSEYRSNVKMYCDPCHRTLSEARYEGMQDGVHQMQREVDSAKAHEKQMRMLVKFMWDYMPDKSVIESLGVLNAETMVKLIQNIVDEENAEEVVRHVKNNGLTPWEPSQGKTPPLNLTGGVLYTDGGKLKYKHADGTITTIGPA